MLKYFFDKPYTSASASISSFAAVSKYFKESKGKAANMSGYFGTKPDLTTKLGKSSNIECM
jgi:hypothetical protein